MVSAAMTQFCYSSTKAAEDDNINEWTWLYSSKTVFMNIEI